MKRKSDTSASAVYDGELDVSSSVLGTEAVASASRDFSRLSRLLRVPRGVGDEDPYFLTRFRQRRDALRAGVQALAPWRRVAIGLVPVAASAVLAAVVVIVLSKSQDSSLGELEMRALGTGVGEVTLETTEVEPVLRIALGEL